MNGATRKEEKQFVEKVAQLGFPAITALGIDLLRRLMSDGEEEAPSELELNACERAVGALSRRDYDGHQRLFQRALDVLWSARELSAMALQTADEIERCAQQLALLGLVRVSSHADGLGPFMLDEKWEAAARQAAKLGDDTVVALLESEARTLEVALGVALLTVRQEAALNAVRQAAAWVNGRLTVVVADLAACTKALESDRQPGRPESDP